MRVDENNRLIPARQVESPNCDDRPAGESVGLVVIHAMSLPPGEFGGSYIDELFTNSIDLQAHPSFESLDGVRVSSHLVVDRNGQVTQYVPFHRRAWHAGVSEYQGRVNCNDFSIGIELEGTESEPFADVQYTRLASILQALMARYPSISAGRIVGHSEVARGRKWDPGPQFDWQRLMRMIREAN